MQAMLTMNELYKRLDKSINPNERLGLIKAIVKFYGSPKKLKRLIKMMVDKKLSDDETIYIVTKVLPLDSSRIFEYLELDPNYLIVNSYPELKIRFSKYLSVNNFYFNMNVLKGLPENELRTCKKFILKKQPGDYSNDFFRRIEFCETFPEISNEQEITENLDSLIDTIKEDIQTQIINVRNRNSKDSSHIYRSTISYRDLTKILQKYSKYLTTEQRTVLVTSFNDLSEISKDDREIQLEDVLTIEELDIVITKMVTNKIVSV